MRNGRNFEGWAALAVIGVGVLLSNFLAYREVNLAPRDQLAELERIGEQIAGDGPTLMTEYQPYGARHFLRDSDPQSLSELRPDLIPLTSGGVVRKGLTADTDELRLDGLLAFRTLVLRRSPAQSRPPSQYRLVSSGSFYEVWQREPGTKREVVTHLPLGVGPGTAVWDARTTRTSVPDCAEVRRLAAEAPTGAELIAAENTEPVVVDSGVVFPDGGEVLEGDATVAGGDYGVWVVGGVRSRVAAELDGHAAGSIRSQLNNSGLYLELGETRLEQGAHDLRLEVDGPSLAHPGSRGPAQPLGPVLLGTSSDRSTLRRVPLSRAESLCGSAWDWIEVVRAQ
jgi:hypothetical protein